MSTSSNDLDIGLVFVSCDKYSDLWGPAFDLFFKNWPDCPFPVYLIANQKFFFHPRVTTLLSGNDVDWSSSVKSALKDFKHSHIFFWMDDAFLTKKVDTPVILAQLKEVIDLKTNFFRYRKDPTPSTSVNHRLYEIQPGEPYRVNVFLSLWPFEILMQILKDGESAWQFELKGSERSNKFDKFFSIKENYFEYIHGVERGVWIRSAYRALKQKGYDIDINYRPVMSPIEQIRHRYRVFKSFVFHVLPAGYRGKFLKDVSKIYKALGLR